MCNSTAHEQPQASEKEQSAGAGAAFPCQEWMKRMMAEAHSFCKPMWAACCGKIETPTEGGKKEG
jgi:hypothetical protein